MDDDEEMTTCGMCDKEEFSNINNMCNDCGATCIKWNDVREFASVEGKKTSSRNQVCYTTGKIRYVIPQEKSGMLYHRKNQVCYTTGKIRYVIPQEKYPLS